MASQSRAQLFADLRREYQAGSSKRALKRKYHVSSRTIVAALDSVFPRPRRRLPDRVSRLDQFKGLIDEWLRADLRRAAQAAAHRQADLRPAARRA